MAPPAIQSSTYATRTDSTDEVEATSAVDSALTRQQRETAQYVADMILELRNMARSAKLHHVLAPLELAYYEAFSVANKVHVPPEEVEHIRKLSRTVEESEASKTT